MGFINFNNAPRSSSGFLSFSNNRPESSSKYKGLFPFKEFTFSAVGDFYENGATLGMCQTVYSFSSNGVAIPGYGLGGNTGHPRLSSYAYASTGTSITIKFTTSAAFTSSGFYLCAFTQSSGQTETITVYNDDTGSILFSNTKTSVVADTMSFELYSFPSYKFIPGITYKVVISNKASYYGLTDTRYYSSAVVRSSFSLPKPLNGTITRTYDNSSFGTNMTVWGLYINEIANLSNTNWASNSNYFTVGSIPGYQLWTVPETGSYFIEAAGARGGSAKYTGAPGALISGTFLLTKGSKLWICVGQIGSDGNSGTSDLMGAGGGGGSFVVLADPNNPTDHTSLNTIPLLIAAGGQGSQEARLTTGSPPGGSATTGDTDIGFSAAPYGYNKGVTGSLQFRGITSSGGLTGQITSYSTMTTRGGFGGGRSWDDSYGNSGGYTIPNPAASPDGTPTYSYTSPLARNPAGTSGWNTGLGYVYIQLQ